MYTAFLVSLPEAVIVTDAVIISDGRKITIFWGVTLYSLEDRF